MSFSALKKQRGNFQDLTKKLADDKKGGGGGDDRYWSLSVDDVGNGYAKIRFLPAPDGEEMPYVKVYEHAFKDKVTNKWYIEKSRTTLGEADPVAEANSELWNTNIEANKEIARARKRNLRYIANILVIDDSMKPENNGKVFLYKFGAKIFGMIENALAPKFKDETPFNPFDLWEGADFKLKASVVEKQRSYERSGFETPAALYGGDDKKLEDLWRTEYSLQAEVAPDKFKPYDVLKTRFLAVIGQPAPRKADTEIEKVEREFNEAPRATPVATRAPAPAKDDDDELSAYAGLLDGFDDDKSPF